jgi:hypothetical protein
MKSVYIETSIVSYLTSRPSRDLRAAAWQEVTAQWWAQERPKYELFASELVIVEASAGDEAAAASRLEMLKEISELPVDDEAKALAAKLVEGGGVPSAAPADALHIAVAAVQAVDYLLTWNCRHIDNAVTKPTVRSICAAAGYTCPEICTPLELLAEEEENVSG